MEKIIEESENEKIKKQFEEGKKKAREILDDEDKLEQLLQKMEKNLKFYQLLEIHFQ